MVSIDPRRLQHTFSKHAQDFGIRGNWKQLNATLLEQAIRDHVTNPSVQKIAGTYRGNVAVTHYYDPATDLWVALDTAGTFIAGWKLTTAQKAYLLSPGNVQ